MVEPKSPCEGAEAGGRIDGQHRQKRRQKRPAGSTERLPAADFRFTSPGGTTYSGIMFDRVLTSLLLLGLLTCPVRCALGAVGASGSPSQATVRCSCCKAAADAGQQEVSSEEDPQPAEDDCGCTDCLCQGAISEAASHRDLAEDLTASATADLLSPALLLDQLGPSGAPRTVGGDQPPASWCWSGRQTRIAHQSFLI